MGYDVTINRCELTLEKMSMSEKVFRKLKYGPLRIDSYYWKVDGNRIEPIEWFIKWGDWFEKDLIKMARAGVTGWVETIGEEGEYTKYALRNGKVEEYYGKVVYPKKPEKTYGG